MDLLKRLRELWRLIWGDPAKDANAREDDEDDDEDDDDEDDDEAPEGL